MVMDLISLSDSVCGYVEPDCDIPFVEHDVFMKDEIINLEGDHKQPQVDCSFVEPVTDEKCKPIPDPFPFEDMIPTAIRLDDMPLEAEREVKATGVKRRARRTKKSTNVSHSPEAASSVMSSIEFDELTNGAGDNCCSSISRTLCDRYSAATGSANTKKLRTPRTLTRLMQQHRENERHRHHGLNASIKEISSHIPGYEDACNETKIVKLQRIINYILHLEEHIQTLCHELGLDLEFKNLFLLPHVPKQQEPTRKNNSGQECGGTNDDNSPPPSGRNKPPRTYRKRNAEDRLTNIIPRTKVHKRSTSPEVKAPKNTGRKKQKTEEFVSLSPETIIDEEEDILDLPKPVNPELEDTWPYQVPTRPSSPQQYNHRDSSTSNDTDWLNSGLHEDCSLPSGEYDGTMTPPGEPSGLLQSQDYDQLLDVLDLTHSLREEAEIEMLRLCEDGDLDENLLPLYTSPVLDAPPTTPSPCCTYTPGSAQAALSHLDTPADIKSPPMSRVLFSRIKNELNSAGHMPNTMPNALTGSPLSTSQANPAIQGSYPTYLNSSQEFNHSQSFAINSNPTNSLVDDDSSRGFDTNNIYQFITQSSEEVPSEPIWQDDQCGNDGYASHFNDPGGKNVWQNEFNTAPVACSQGYDSVGDCKTNISFASSNLQKNFTHAEPLLDSNKELKNENTFSPTIQDVRTIKEPATPTEASNERMAIKKMYIISFQNIKKEPVNEQDNQSCDNSPVLTEMYDCTNAYSLKGNEFTSAQNDQFGHNSNLIPSSPSSLQIKIEPGEKPEQLEMLSPSQTSAKGRIMVMVPEENDLKEMADIRGTSNETVSTGPTKPVIKKKGGKIIFKVPANWQYKGISKTDEQIGCPLAPGEPKNIILESDSIKRVCRSSKKVDHRKTSWMNGFMMYSRLHRKHYIDENPGLHTSSISKLMGQAWRSLPEPQQEPYKEKARMYIQHVLQTAVDVLEDEEEEFLEDSIPMV